MIDTTKSRSITEFLPYRSMVDINTVKTADDSYVRVIKLQGVSHETADDIDINSWNDQLNNLLKSIASNQVAIWTHIVRRKTKLYPRGDFRNSFAHDFNEKYKAHITKDNLFVNELYLTIVFREQAEGYVKSFGDIISSAFTKKTKEDILIEQEKSLEKIQLITSDVLKSLSDFNPILLGAYTLNKIVSKIDGKDSVYYEEKSIKKYKDFDKNKDGFLYSELLEFLSFLLNGFHERVRFPHGESSNYLPSSKIYWNNDRTLIENPKGTIYGSSIGVISYQDETSPIMLDDLLDVPFEFVLSHSLTFRDRVSGMRKIQTQYKRLDSTEDVGVTQQNDLLQAMEDLQAHKFDMGNYSFSLFIKSDKFEDLNDYISEAGSILINNGLKWVVEDMASQASYLSMLPANFKYRPRLSLITTMNFAGLSPLHGIPVGKYAGNQWGNAVTIFQTVSGSPYYFNFHTDDLNNHVFDENLENYIEDENAEESEDFEFSLANTIVAGQSGSGKTVLEMFLLTQSFKFDTEENPATFICTDSERGMSIGVKALGGKFFDISKDEKRESFNPFLLPYSISNVSFLVDLVKVLVEDNAYKVSPSEEELLTKTIGRILKADNPKNKRISSLLDFITDVESDGLSQRLSKWCGNGIHSWVFDNEKDTFDIDNNKLFCFEMSEFLDDDEIRPAISMYFFHRLSELMDKRRLIIFLDEFWQILKDDYFRNKIEGLLKRIRKQNGFLVMFTQSPSDFINSPISRTLIEQTATQILLPNTKGKKSEYVDEFGLTEMEWETLKSLGQKSRMFLIKQGSKSVLAELNLKGFEHDLAVFSATTQTMEAVNKLEEIYGYDPNNWLPKFYDYIDGKKVF